MAGAKKKVKKKDIKITHGILHVSTTSNNTIVTLCDHAGNKVVGGGAGTVGFKGAKQSTPYAAELVTKEVLQQAKKYGLEKIAIVFRGVGLGREGVFKAINEGGLVEIEYIKENTPLQHGGCRGIRPKRN